MRADEAVHYAFDMWMGRNHPGVPFERYADDAICHCRSEAQARALRASLERRFADCGLTLHRAGRARIPKIGRILFDLVPDSF
jgi:retron-type reverse transcriptase